MAATVQSGVTTQVYRVYIKATPQAIWDAITRPEWTERYGYGGRAQFELRPQMENEMVVRRIVIDRWPDPQTPSHPQM